LFVWLFGARFGVHIATALIVLGLAWWQWGTIRSLPGVSQKSLPKADPKRFAVAIAHLENDPDHQHEILIVEALKDFEGVQILRFDRTISISEGTQPEEAEKAGHDKAGEYLKESGADALIWGIAHHMDGKSAPRLYWTTSQQSRRSKEVYQPDNFKLPDLFWGDLVEVLRLVVATYNTEFFAQEGQFIGNQLDLFTAKVRTLLAKSQSKPGWNPDARTLVRSLLARSLIKLGEQGGKNEPLEEAITACREVLQEWTHERKPLLWAVMQNNLGVALVILGERGGGTALLEEAVVAYRAALEERTQKRLPLDWAATQNNLCVALATLGEREERTQRLEEAVTACRTVLTEYTRKRVPLRWAVTQDNLCVALLTLGKRGNGTARLKEAVTACREALTEYTRERVPLDWARTQVDLGSALAALGERSKNAASLCEALQSHLVAWEVLSAKAVYDTSAVANSVEEDIALLKKELNPATYQECLARHEDALRRMGLP